VGVIGDTLTEARTRRAVDLDQIEAATGVRTRYLRAIEAEDWNALPEEFYARSFIRKYAGFVGVDPEPLVTEYRRQRGTEGRGAAPTSPFATTTSRRAEALRRRRKRQGVYAWVATAAAAALVVVAIVLLASSGGDGGGSKGADAGGGNGSGAGVGHGGKSAAKAGADGAKSQGGAAKTGGAGKNAGGQGGGPGTGGASGATKDVTLKVEPTAEVWACVENAAGKPVVDGATLAAGKSVGPFHSRSFTVAFGNGSVALWVDGKRADTPSSPDPIGLSIQRGGKLHQLPEGTRPSCE
jgi:cytoskeleton protein RodZ